MPQEKSTTTKTFALQDELPSLPVPKLEDTLNKYYDSARALLNEQQQERAKELIDEFKSSPLASNLQQALENRARNNKNWLDEWWYDAYTTIREPLTPFLSIASITTKYPPLKGSQIHRAADATYNWMKFWKSIRNETLPTTRSRGAVWDMHQYYCLFNANRTPMTPKDRMDRYFKSESEGSCPSHIIVLCGGNIWKLELLRNNEIKSPDELYHTYKFIMANSPKKEHCISTLTAEHRDVWSELRQSIISHSENNKKNIQTIEESAFVMALTDKIISEERESLERAMMDESQLAWRDKSVCHTMYADGQMTTLGDHSNVDAIVILHAGDDAAFRVRNEIWTPNNVDFERPQLLEFDLSQQHLNAIEKAEKLFQNNKQLYRSDVLRFTEYGNEALRKRKIYTDTVIQIALQLAFAKTHNRQFAPIYETASTRKFYKGRTETVRGCTREFVNFANSVFDGKDIETQRKLFKDAYDAHNYLMNECMEGRGFDRHLLGLKNTLAEMNKGCGPKQFMPKIFTGYLVNNDGGFGYVCAMRPDGYGTFYKIDKELLMIIITDWKNTKSDLDAYGRNIKWALTHLGAILLGSDAKL
ncbi:hypothetical protein WR25_05420 [Diploscapter pachys]|uniref:Choline/carnitine acyltransferase domain-containing protein n=1 Tax=Diploscapter pachys TaxID=2018661 RepID=A0A2A2KA40_9BILA|nr:hypothetical protein WR25_05420 [Diploscapter pachys]